MKATTVGILTVTLVAFFFGCGQADERYAEQSAPAPFEFREGEGSGTGAAPPMAAADSAMAPEDSRGVPVSSSAAVENRRDTTRKFIRTADLKFKVKNVVKTTYQIEDIAARFDGFVTNTQLQSIIDRKNTIAISADSSLETTYYTVVNTMTLRVPNTKLDSTLKAIAPLIDFLDHRNISANDISLSLLSNQLTQQRMSEHEARLKRAIDTRGRKLEETTTAEENVVSRQEQSDAARIDNLSLIDQVNYSTIHLNIYQRQSFTREVIPNDTNIEEYEPGLGTKIVEALEIGWVAFVAVLVFLAKFWALILTGIVVYVLYRKFGDRMKS